MRPGQGICTQPARAPRPEEGAREVCPPRCGETLRRRIQRGRFVRLRRTATGAPRPLRGRDYQSDGAPEAQNAEAPACARHVAGGGTARVFAVTCCTGRVMSCHPGPSRIDGPVPPRRHRRRYQRSGVQERQLDTSGPVRPPLVAMFGWLAEQKRTRHIQRTKAGLEGPALRADAPRRSSPRARGAHTRRWLPPRSIGNGAHLDGDPSRLSPGTARWREVSEGR
jgi:hypothetical protein